MFYELVTLISLCLMTTGNGDLKENTTSDAAAFVGTWEWVSTTVSGRGGQNTTTAEESGIKKTLIITADKKLSIYTDGKLECESTFELRNGINSDDPLFMNIKNECIKGNFSIQNGMIKQYQYLGCPSSNTYYRKVK